MKCVICKGLIQKEFSGWDQGHNAEPFKTGRCCSVCNWTKVIPSRLKALTASYAEQKTVKVMKEDRKHGTDDPSAA